MIERCLALDLIVDPDVPPLPAARLIGLASFAASEDGAFPGGNWSVTLRVTDDEQIAAIHDQFFGDSTATDVISFPSGDDLSGGEGYLGDIVISVETAAENAGIHGHSRDREVAFLLLHGLLHLCGFDDATDEARVAMLNRQSTILDAFERETGAIL